MPEGDTIFRAAAKLRESITGHEIRDAQTQSPGLEADSLVGRSLESIESRGKHLLMHLSGGLVIHSHMGMHGAWHVYQRQDRWRKPATQAELVLQFDRAVAVCFSPKLLELLSTGELARHRWLTRLGPDLLAENFDPAEALARFRRRAELPIGEAVMNQSIVSGIGNVYKSELLFLARVHPRMKVADLPDEVLTGILTQARRLLQRNVLKGPRRTRFRGDRFRHWVYGRQGEACLKCSATIQLTRQGDLGRTTYYCPECQSTNDK